MDFAVNKKMDGLGRVVLPKNLRDYYGITKNDRLKLIPIKEGILIVKAESDDSEEKKSSRK